MSKMIEENLQQSSTPIIFGYYKSCTDKEIDDLENNDHITTSGLL